MAVFQAFAAQFEFDFPAPMPDEGDAVFGGLLLAMDTVGYTGAGHLMQEGRLVSSGENAFTLTDCE